MREEDYVQAQYLNLKLGQIAVSMGIFVIFAFAWMAYFSPPWIGFLIPLLMVLILWVVIPFQAKRTYRQYKALSEAVSVEVRSNGLYFRREYSEGLLPWDHIIKWRQNKALVLLYPANNVFYMIPRHFFPNNTDFEAFKNLVCEHAGRAA